MRGQAPKGSRLRLGYSRRGYVASSGVVVVLVVTSYSQRGYIASLGGEVAAVAVAIATRGLLAEIYTIITPNPLISISNLITVNVLGIRVVFFPLPSQRNN